MFNITKIFLFCESLKKKKKVESKDVSSTTLVYVGRNVSSRSLEALGVMLEVKDKMNPSQHKDFFIQFAGYQPG